MCQSISLTIKFNKEGEYLWTTSRPVRTLTNLSLGAHYKTRSLTTTANNSGPNLVPCGIPPFRYFLVEMRSSIRVNWDLPCKQAATHLINALCKLNPESLLRRILWLIKSKALQKSANNNLTEQLPQFFYNGNIEISQNVFRRW